MARKRKDEAAQDDIEEVEETVEEADDNSSLDTVEEASFLRYGRRVLPQIQ